MRKILIRGGILVTMNQKEEIIEGDLVICGKRIAAIIPRAPSNRANAQSTLKEADTASSPTHYDQVIDATGKAVLPGLIQTHVHLCQTLFRGQADDLELLDWLRRRIWPLEAAHNEESLYYSAMLGCAELFRGGTTCILDMETVHHTDAAIQSLLENGMRAVTGKVMMDHHGADIPPGLQENTTTSLQESIKLLEKWHGQDDGRIRYAFSPRFAVSCTDRLLREVARLASEYGVMIHTHASENRSEVDLILRERGERNVLYLHKIGLTGPNLLLAHCIWLDPAEMQVLQETGTRVAHCPSSNLKLASGIAPVPELLSRGISVSLGADGAPCGNNLDMFMEMRLAALLHKVSYGPTAMPAAQVLKMATIEGARALGLAAEIGSLEVGKRADLILVNLDQLHQAPSTGVDLVSRLVYATRASDVETTVIDGRIVMHQRKLLTINEAEVIARCNRILTRFEHN
ncbi:MAG: 5'-deoxyadenosine deaminase [Syntrophomonadaceae bacterium]|nr:5'-deoxyadenosine deaminase [Syntrophomonadaceae bacterium]